MIGNDRWPARKQSVPVKAARLKQSGTTRAANQHLSGFWQWCDRFSGDRGITITNNLSAPDIFRKKAMSA